MAWFMYIFSGSEAIQIKDRAIHIDRRSVARFFKISIPINQIQSQSITQDEKDEKKKQYSRTDLIIQLQNKQNVLLSSQPEVIAQLSKILETYGIANIEVSTTNFNVEKGKIDWKKVGLTFCLYAVFLGVFFYALTLFLLT